MALIISSFCFKALGSTAKLAKPSKGKNLFGSRTGVADSNLMQFSRTASASIEEEAEDEAGDEGISLAPQ